MAVINLYYKYTKVKQCINKSYQRVILLYNTNKFSACYIFIGHAC